MGKKYSRRQVASLLFCVSMCMLFILLVPENISLAESTSESSIEIVESHVINTAKAAITDNYLLKLNNTVFSENTQNTAVIPQTVVNTEPKVMPTTVVDRTFAAAKTEVAATDADEENQKAKSDAKSEPISSSGETNDAGKKDSETATTAENTRKEASDETEAATEETSAADSSEATKETSDDPTSSSEDEDTSASSNENLDTQEPADENTADEASEDPADEALVSTDNYDPDYEGTVVSVDDRDALEGLVMGEFGTDYTGACLVAQTIRDTMVYTGNYSVLSIKEKFGYTAPVNPEVSDDVKAAVSFIFDDGGYAVKHRLIYFYSYYYCDSAWHESQNFVVSYGGCRFFDAW